MDSNIENPLSESESKNMGSAEQPAEEQPAAEQQIDTWYTSEQLAAEPAAVLLDASSPDASESPLQPEIIMSPPPYTPSPAAQAPPPKKNNTVTIILIVLLVLLCVCCLCTILIFAFMGNLFGGLYQGVVDILNSFFGGAIVIQ